jgi:hypothetical protein
MDGDSNADYIGLGIENGSGPDAERKRTGTLWDKYGQQDIFHHCKQHKKTYPDLQMVQNFTNMKIIVLKNITPRESRA